nr:response regulator [Anaerolineae bacterium]
MNRKSKLLIVDDEPDLLAELKPLLERSGFEVVTAMDGEQALERVEACKP